MSRDFTRREMLKEEVTLAEGILEELCHWADPRSQDRRVALLNEDIALCEERLNKLRASLAETEQRHAHASDETIKRQRERLKAAKDRLFEFDNAARIRTLRRLTKQLEDSGVSIDDLANFDPSREDDTPCAWCRGQGCSMCLPKPE